MAIRAQRIHARDQETPSSDGQEAHPAKTPKSLDNRSFNSLPPLCPLAMPEQSLTPVWAPSFLPRPFLARRR